MTKEEIKQMFIEAENNISREKDVTTVKEFLKLTYPIYRTHIFNINKIATTSDVFIFNVDNKNNIVTNVTVEYTGERVSQQPVCELQNKIIHEAIPAFFDHISSSINISALH